MHSCPPCTYETPIDLPIALLHPSLPFFLEFWRHILVHPDLYSCTERTQNAPSSWPSQHLFFSWKIWEQPFLHRILCWDPSQYGTIPEFPLLMFFFRQRPLPRYHQYRRGSMILVRLPSRVLTPRGAWARNLLHIGVFPTNCLKTAWFWRNLEGQGGLGPKGPPWIRHCNLIPSIYFGSFLCRQPFLLDLHL